MLVFDVLGVFHSMAWTTKGVLYVWGWNTFGQLGLGALVLSPTTPEPTPVAVLEDLAEIVVQAVGGYSHTLIRTASGRIYAAGANRQGQLGIGDRSSRRTPEAVPLEGVFFTDVSAGLYHSLACDKSGFVWAWGWNNRGQLGLCASKVRDQGPAGVCYVGVESASGFYDALSPARVEALSSVQIVAVVAGTRHSLALSALGDLYAWGDNSAKQLGVPYALDAGGNAILLHVAPQLVRQLRTPGLQCAAPQASVGEPEESQEAVVRSGQRYPRCVTAKEWEDYGARAVGMAAGDGHSLLVVEQQRQLGEGGAVVHVRRLYVMGANAEGQLGQGDLGQRLEPEMVGGVRQTPREEVVGLVAAFSHSGVTAQCPTGPNGEPCSGQGLCYHNGTCKCEEGVRGRDCSFECRAGKANPCSGNGDQQKAQTIARRRQLTLALLAGSNLRPVLLNQHRLRVGAIGSCAAGAQAGAVRCSSSGTFHLSESDCASLCLGECVAAGAGDRCMADNECARGAKCVWTSPPGSNFSIPQVLDELLQMGAKSPPLLPLMEYVAFGIENANGRTSSRCPADETANTTSEEDEYTSILLRCGAEWDTDGDGEYTVDEVTGLWEELQSRGLDPQVTGREFQITLRVDPRDEEVRWPRPWSSLTSECPACDFRAIAFLTGVRAIDL